MGASDSTFSVRYRDTKNESPDNITQADMAEETRVKDSMEIHASDDHAKTVILFGASVSRRSESCRGAEPTILFTRLHAKREEILGVTNVDFLYEFDLWSESEASRQRNQNGYG